MCIYLSCTSVSTAVTKSFFYFVLLYKFLYFVLSEEFLLVFLNVIFISRKLRNNWFLQSLSFFKNYDCFLSSTFDLCARYQNSQSQNGFIIFRMGLSRALVLMPCIVRHYAPLRLWRSESVPTRNIHEPFGTAQTVAYGAH